MLRDFLSSYGKEIADVLAEKQIGFDGKKLKEVSPQSRENHGLYIVNAFVTENKICVGQEKVVDKSNELDALPKLIKSLNLTGAVATIDAIGCHKHVASQIKEQNRHHLLTLKKNQKEPLEEVFCTFKAKKPI